MTALRIPISYKSNKGKVYSSTASALSLPATTAAAPQNGPPDGGVHSSSRLHTGTQTVGVRPHGKGTTCSSGAASAQRPSTDGDLGHQEPETALLISPVQRLGHSLLK